MASARFIAYQPTGLQMVDGRATHADESSIAADLTVLRSRFDGLITYGTLHGAERVPDVAARLGFKAVILGVWDVANEQEIDNAIAAWTRHPRLVVGASLGNEVVFEQRGDFETLRRAIDTVRAKAPGLALSTTEPFHVFLTDDARPIFVDADFLLANVHPVFQPWFAARVGGDRGAVRRQRRRSACDRVLRTDPRQRDRRAHGAERGRLFRVAPGGVLHCGCANCLRRRRHARSRTFRRSTRRGESRTRLRSTVNIPRKRIGGCTTKPGGQKPSSRQFQSSCGEFGTIVVISGTLRDVD